MEIIKMKKIIGILAAAALLFAVSSCANDDGTSSVDSAVQGAQNTSAVAEEASAKADEVASKGKDSSDDDEDGGDEDDTTYSAISFSANDLTAGDITSDLEVSKTFTIHATSSNKWTVDANSKTLSNIKYTNRLKSNGVRTSANCVLQFEDVAAGTYTVDFVSGSSTDTTRTLVVVDSDGTTTLATLAAPTTAGSATFTLSSNKEAIYIGTNAAVNIYGIHK